VAQMTRTLTFDALVAADAAGRRVPGGTRSIFAWVARGMSPISSRKIVPPSALLEICPSGARTALVKAPFFMAEELALEERFGEGGAVDVDERTGHARARGVECPGHQFLAGAAFPEK